MKLPRLAFFGFCLAAGCASMTGCNTNGLMGPTSSASSEAEFQATVERTDTVLVKFGAPWCGPCVKTDGEIDKLQPKLPENIEVIKIDVDDSPSLAAEYNVSGIPHFVLFQQGQPVGSRTGYMSAEDLERWLTGSSSGLAPAKQGSVQENPFAAN